MQISPGPCAPRMRTWFLYSGVGRLGCEESLWLSTPLYPDRFVSFLTFCVFFSAMQLLSSGGIRASERGGVNDIQALLRRGRLLRMALLPEHVPCTTGGERCVRKAWEASVCPLRQAREGASVLPV